MPCWPSRVSASTFNASTNALSTSVVTIVETCAESGKELIRFVMVVWKVASSLMAAANSFRVSRLAGAPPTKLLISVST